MDPSSELNEVIEQTTLSPSQAPKLNVIKKEVCDEDLSSKPDQFDDYDFEPFHENIFRTLSANFDNTKNIDEVNEAYEKLENCFIENNILTKNGSSKITFKGPPSSTVFLKYRDVDDAFMDMVICESTVKLKNRENSPKKVDLKSFQDSFFTVNLNDSPLSDNEEAQSKTGETDSEGIEEFESHLEGFQSEIDVSDCEVSAADEIDDVLRESEALSDAEVLDVNTIPECDIKSVNLTHPLPNTENEYKSDLVVEQKVEVPCDTVLKETIRDVRVVVKKLPSDISEHSPNIEENDDNVTCPTESLPNLSSKMYRQVARKRTGGMVINNSLNPDSTNKEQKVIQQLSSVDGDFVPNVFDKMTRAGKRDLERILKESTSSSPKQKTTQLIPENFKEYQSDDKDSDISSSEDESKVHEAQKTAEIVKSTILKFLSKTGSKKLEKLGKDIIDEIANKLNNFQFNIEAGNKEEPTTTQSLISPNKLISSLEVTEKTVDNKLVKSNEKTVENKLVKGNEKTEENIHRRVTRETSRINAQKNRNTRKSTTLNSRKTLAEQFEEIERVERDIINCELTASLLDEEADEPRRPETRQSKLKLQENLKGTCEHVPKFEAKRPIAPKRKSVSKSKKKVTGRNPKKHLRNISTSGDIEPLTEGQLIDGQFLIDTELNEDSVLSVCDSDLSKISKSNDSPFADRTILKASADSTTTENGFISNETSSDDLIGCVEDHLLLSAQSSIENAADEFVISDVKIISKSVFDESNSNSEDNRVGEECQSKYFKEANLKQTSLDKKFGLDVNDGGLISVKESKEIVTSVGNKKKVEIEEVSKTAQDKYEAESVKGKSSLEKHRPLNQQQQESYEIGKRPPPQVADTSLDFEVKSDRKIADKGTVKSDNHLSVDVHESATSVSEPFKVLNDIITDIERNVLQEKSEPKELDDKRISSKSGLGLDHDRAFTAEDELKESSSHSMEVSADSTSILSYTMDDSLRLMIDEGVADDLTEKDMDLDTSLESNESNELIKENCESNNSKLESVIDNTREIENSKTERKLDILGDINVNKQICFSKPLTNEEKIAQLTKRDPRLVNDKKIVNVLMRDPRIRNKLPKVEEGREKLPEPVILDSPLSPDPEQVAPPLNPLATLAPQENEEKKTIKKESIKSELPDPSVDLNRKKKFRKRVDEELIYKTPLSDLHETNTDRPTYDRNNKKKRSAPPGKKGKEVEEDGRTYIHRRNRAHEELTEEGGYSHPSQDSMAEGYYKRDSYDERNFMCSNTDERNRRPEGDCYGEKFEGRNFHQEERVDFHPGSRDNYEQEAYARRIRNEENYGAVRDRNDFPDNHIYSRREFYRRNKYAHDHDHFGNSSRFMDTRHESQLFPKQNTFAVPAENVFRVSAYPPVSLLPDPMYSQEEEFDQSFGNMDTDSFSPPSSDLCPPPPLIRTPSPEILRRDNYCPSPPRIGRGASPNEREYEEYNRSFHRNYERDERSYRGRNRDNGNNRGYRGANYRRGQGRDYRWNEDSPPRKRFAPEYQRGRDDRGHTRRSPSWSPERLRSWSRERSLSPPHEPNPWDSPRTPSPPRWYDNYRERMPPYKNYQRYN